MGIQDLIITPIWFFLLLIGAYVLRPMVTNADSRPYFIPGLLVKFIGAIALGFIFQFYYGGGDTFTFHTHGSRWIWKAFMEEPLVGLKLILTSGGNYDGDIFEYASKIWMYRDSPSYFVIRITALFDIITFGTYTATALFFATFAFSGLWALYFTFQKLLPEENKKLALVCLFVPSVVFWGSGILKDSITLGALSWMTFGLFEVVKWRKNIYMNSLVMLFFGWILFSIKIYILLCFVASVSFYLYTLFSSNIKTSILKVMILPVLIVLFIGGGYLLMNQISKGDSRYALDKIGETAMITAYDIRYGWGARNGENSGYTLGELDGSLGSLIRLAPQGIIVTLFRPWLWEARNPLMLLAAIESFIFFIITTYLMFKFKWRQLWQIASHPVIVYCLGFSLLFAFAVGVSTYNFGTLMRYKIPIMPLYAIALILLNSTYRIR